MTGERTYQLRCDGCACVYRSSVTILPAPTMLNKIRKLASKESWKHDIVQVHQGPNPSLDFCSRCNAEETRAEIIMRVMEGMRI